jgi:hypothetical protein
VPDSPQLPQFVNWPSFPFEGQLRTKRLDAPVPVEPPREGEDPNTCTACKASDERYVWVSDRWRVRAMERPSGLPMVLILESRSHLDLGDLPNLHAAELGVMTVRIERAIRSLDEVERVHVNRWGDGAAHFHQWFLGRPTGYLQLRGSFLSQWDDILEPIPEGRWRENLAHVAAWLADFGGRAIAEPPRIEWHTPSRFGDVDVVSADPAEATAPAGGASQEAEHAPQAENGGQSETGVAAQPQADGAGRTSGAAEHRGSSRPSGSSRRRRSSRQRGRLHRWRQGGVPRRCEGRRLQCLQLTGEGPRAGTAQTRR